MQFSKAVGIGRERKANMKKRIIVFIVLLSILLGGYFIAAYFNEDNEKEEYEEYIPQEEISESQYRETIINLYFLNKNSNELMAEAIAIDARELAINPYKKLIELLLNGTTNENLQKIIPEGTVVYDAGIEAGCVVINLSKEILNFGEDEVSKKNIINSIFLTLSELTEVNSIRFLVEGEESPLLSEEYNKVI